MSFPASHLRFRPHLTRSISRAQGVVAVQRGAACTRKACLQASSETQEGPADAQELLSANPAPGRIEMFEQPQAADTYASCLPIGPRVVHLLDGGLPARRPAFVHPLLKAQRLDDGSPEQSETAATVASKP